MIVLLIGDTNGGRDHFYTFAIKNGRPHIFWLNNIDSPTVDLVVHFGGTYRIADPNIKKITWSGDHLETLHRVYKTLGLE
jgi:hypothetical protein